MATAAPTPSLGAVYTAPTHVPPSLWIFPPALDWEFVSKFNARLPLSSERRADETGTFRLLPPSPYSDNYQLPDVIVDALDNLTLPQLVGAPDVGASRQFGMGMSEPVESGHVIKLNWEGDEEKIVRMTCHICAAAGKDKDQTKTKCRSLPRAPDETFFAVSSIVTGDETLMADQFKNPPPWDVDYNWTDTTFDFKLRPSALTIVPTLPVPNSSWVCMYTLDWDRWSFGSDHSAPFPVYGGPNYLDRPYSDRIEFNEMHPTGVQMYPPTNIGDNDDSYRGGSGSGSGSGTTEHSPFEKSVAAAFGSIVGVMIVVVLLVYCYRARHGEKKKKGSAAAVRTGGVSGTPVSETPRRDSSPVAETPDLEAPPPTYQEAIRSG